MSGYESKFLRSVPAKTTPKSIKDEKGQMNKQSTFIPAPMKFSITIAVLIVCLTFTSTAQVKTEKNKNIILVEGLGSGGLYSVCYERLFLRREYFNMAFHLGFSKFSTRLTEDRYIPIELIGMIGRNHRFEFGCGINLQRWRLITTNDNHYFSDQFLILRLGYRYQKPVGSFVFRAGIVTITAEGGGIIWPAIAAGYAF